MPCASFTLTEEGLKQFTICIILPHATAQRKLHSRGSVMWQECIGLRGLDKSRATEEQGGVGCREQVVKWRIAHVVSGGGMGARMQEERC